MITDLRGFPVPNISGSDNQTTAEKIGQNRYFLLIVVNEIGLTNMGNISVYSVSCDRLPISTIRQLK